MTQRKNDEVIDEITRMSEQVAEPLGLKVVDVRMSQAGRRKSLQVTIFAPTHAVGLSDCETMSRQLEALLDERAESQPLIEGSYVLEVQSPGIERELTSQRELSIFAGHRVFVRAKEKMGDLGSEVIGILRSSDEKRLTIGNAVSAGSQKKKGKPTHKTKTKDGGETGEMEPAQIQEAKPVEITIERERLSLVKLMPAEHK